MELALKGTTVEELTAEETVYSSMDDNLHMLQVNVSQPDTQTDVVTSGIQPAVEVSETGIGEFHVHFWFALLCCTVGEEPGNGRDQLWCTVGEEPGYERDQLCCTVGEEPGNGTSCGVQSGRSLGMRPVVLYTVASS